MKICEAGRSTSCCRNPDIRSINTMGADTAGNFEIRAGNSVSITTETNGIRISYTGGITVYDNTDGNIVIDNDLFTINLADDITITGDMIIAGDLTVNGTYYTVHAEHVYTEDDYIILREGATTPLAVGSYAGFQVTKYDGTNDGRLVVDNAGVARVGDVGDEQPLLTRDEAADLTDEDCLVWDAANSKAVTQAIPTAIGTALSGKLSESSHTDTSNKGSVTLSNGLKMNWGRISVTIAPYSGYNQYITMDAPFTSTSSYTAQVSITQSVANYGDLVISIDHHSTSQVNVVWYNTGSATLTLSLDWFTIGF